MVYICGSCKKEFVEKNSYTAHTQQSCMEGNEDDFNKVASLITPENTLENTPEKKEIKKHKLGMIMIVKNEEKRIGITIESVIKIVDCMIVLDTGSKDKTKEIITTLCDENKIPLYLADTIFIDFSTTRNELLKFADDKAEWLLLMDCNDELRYGDKLLEFINTFNGPETGFHIKQEWWSGTLNTYFNCRLIKSGYDYKFKGSVHEYISRLGEDVRIKVPDVILYQDRTQDDNKTQMRWERDEKLLLKSYTDEQGKDPRTVFYLAQTYECLGQFDKALTFFKIRAQQEGFYEERFEAKLRCGKHYINHKNDWDSGFPWLWRAWEQLHRAEPLLEMVKHYIDKDWQSAWMCAKMACDLEYPESAILFVDKDAYRYERWHLLGRVSFYNKKLDDGKLGCEMALKARPGSKIDQHNLEFYTKK